MMIRRLLGIVIIIVAGTRETPAQICNGSLGDPIINITFGSGANPGAALASTLTNYQYVTTDCPQDGFYSVRNTSTACHGNSWHTITDHTGDPNGYFMLVNASVSPGAFYLDTVKGLCGNTTYEFAAWVLNMLKSSSCGGAGIRPNLTFRLEKTDGTVMQSYNTNDIPSSANPEWKQYGFFFTTPAASPDMVLRIINNAQGGCGNDLALDDITFRPCGPAIVTSIGGTSSNSASLCEGTAAAYTFNANVSAGFNVPVVQWQQSVNGGPWTDIGGATAPGYSTNFTASTAAGTYAFRLAAAEAGNIAIARCRVASSPLTITVQANPLAKARGNSPVCEGESILLNATGSGAAWSGPGGFTATGTTVSIGNAQPASAGTYYVTTSNGSCTRLDSTVVVIDPAPVLSISSNTVELCEGDTVVLAIGGAGSYTFNPAIGLSYAAPSLLAHPKDSSSFVIRGTNSYGCSDTALLQVNVIRKPMADAGPDRSVIEGTNVQLSGVVKGDSVHYYWSPGIFINDTRSLAPFVNPSSDTAYVLHAESYFGCPANTDTVHVHVFKKLLVPNAFSPNKDGVNDRWMIRHLESYPGAEVVIFDRYGRQVFRSLHFTGWDGTSGGKPLPVGFYYYFIDVGNKLSVLSGWVLLLR